MKLIKQRTKESRTIFFLGDDLRQRAEITIEFINDEGLKNTGHWDFVGCRFIPTHIPYTREDWEFLSAINDKIKELTK